MLNSVYYCIYCRGGEMVDALALGASAERHAGSSPVLGIHASNTLSSLNLHK